MPRKGALDLYAVRAPTADQSQNTYTVSTTPSGFSSKSYWLPWGHNELVHIDDLNKVGASFFLTSGFSGCHFVGCDGTVMHTAAGYRGGVQSAINEMDELGEDLGKVTDHKFLLTPATNAREPGVQEFPGLKSFYGDGRGVNAGAVRAVVLGWKDTDKNRWFFAYQDQTVRTEKFGVWNPLRG